ncbi:hypothetical protein AS156_18855 [Bradyrhizobium macuxiense]|uniref:Major facilitator superfamily (MFS) profile domain-containing protein n=1 Tax=Bradyrhizobium macuxiense TaxID=1755647 RepID=A0A109JGM2_9BRAD|nr:MFS transporter [Bradyrhizobium macuxiense]KWV48526.1 hypothetical protein AS156_18855 [Bradyrhizobium macuxiense]
MSSASSISARIERIPFSSWHIRILGIVGAAHFFDAFDSLAIAFVMPALVALWSLAPSNVGILIAAGSVGQLIGAIGFSWLAERFGRREALRWSIWLVSIFSFACAFTWSYASFFVCRLIQGVGLGGELPVGVTYINELAQSMSRGKIVLLLQFCFAVGVVIVSFAAVWIVPHFGWQWMFVLGTAPALLALFLRHLLPESPRWLASKGRLKEAEEVVSRLERAAKLHDEDSSALVDLGVSPVTAEQPSKWIELFSRQYIGRTFYNSLAMLCTSFTGSGLLVWMPTIYNTVYKAPLADALAISLYSTGVGLVVCLLAAFIIDRIGRRLTFIMGFLGSGITMLALYGLAQSASLAMIVTLASIGLFFITFNLLGAVLYAAEIYPTRMRALGTGLASGWLRVGSITGPIIVGQLLTMFSVRAVFLFFAGSAMLGAAVVFLAFVETSGRKLEEISR